MDAGPDGGARREVSDRELYKVCAAVILGVMMTFLDTTIVNVALDTIQRSMHASLGSVQWVATAYLLGLGSAIPVSGWLTERFGSRRIWIASLLAFGATSALCGAATSTTQLVVLRALQGVAGGVILPVGMTILAQTTGPRGFARATVFMGIPVLVGPVLGPALGGLIVGGASWRWIFFINAPVTCAAVALAWMHLGSAALGRRDAAPLDVLGLALVCPGVAAIVFGLSEIEQRDGGPLTLVVVPLLAGLVLLTAFVVHTGRSSHPLLRMVLFRSRSFSAAAWTIFLGGGAMIGTWLVLPLYFQAARGESPLLAGLQLGPQGLGVACTIPFAARLSRRHGSGNVVLAGMLVSTASTVPMMAIDSHTSLALVSFLLFVRGLGFGCTLMPAMSAAYETLAARDVPRATSILNMMQRVGGSVATAVFAVALQHEQRVARRGDPGIAFGHTFRWVFLLTFLGLVCACVLALAARSARPVVAAEAS
ncbi:MAG TPA: MDR family MFS transporter [Solirubrobacteraceae bacterium]|jgi:EmrB/QacA subfamily drug resistance transporter|nr:MDR family MFS transporter [Solirubrobacteraceae bacterium]